MGSIRSTSLYVVVLSQAGLIPVWDLLARDWDQVNPGFFRVYASATMIGFDAIVDASTMPPYNN